MLSSIRFRVLVLAVAAIGAQTVLAPNGVAQQSSVCDSSGQYWCCYCYAPFICWDHQPSGVLQCVFDGGSTWSNVRCETFP